MYQLRQSMKPPFFQFRKGRNKKTFHAGTPDGQALYNGTVCVSLTLNGTKYGPYATDIYTFYHIWQGRKSARPSEEARQLAEDMGEYASQVKKIYATLLNQAQLEETPSQIDGPMVMAALTFARKRVKQDTKRKLEVLGLEPDSALMGLEDLYKEFMKSRKRDIEPSRERRRDGQISPSTYRTYPKRWVMIQAYLTYLKRKNHPIRSIRASFGEKMREFLKDHRQKDGKRYELSSVNKTLSFFKMLMNYAQRQGYIPVNPVSNLSCRGDSTAKPKPLTEVQMQMLEEASLPPRLRWICDSWLVAGELCLHYSDFMKLPRMAILADEEGNRYIQHDRNKQRGDGLLQTVDITARAERLLTKYDGPRGLYYGSSSDYADALKIIAIRANLCGKDGQIMPLAFGQGRDTGLTKRVIDGANGLQLSKMAGWANPRVANRYIGLDLEIVKGFTRKKEAVRTHFGFASNSPT